VLATSSNTWWYQYLPLLDGMGVFTTVALPGKEMILEYRGEVIRRPVADRREEHAKQQIIKRAEEKASSGDGVAPATSASSGGDVAGKQPLVSAGELAEASTYMFTVDPASGQIIDATHKARGVLCP
jgi:hypothetical protein